MTKSLAVFDFDHTVVDDNTDTAVIALLDKSKIPNSVKELYRKDGWTAYMQAIFDLLYRNNVDQNKITEAICNIKCVEGFRELIPELKDKLAFDIIIISDSNSYFINAWLKRTNLAQYILRIFTNPAEFVEGSLKINMYHLQDYCKLSTKNLCKGQIMEDFIKEQQSKGVEYKRIVYAGDGSNDICPILRLGVNDVACVRHQYKCAELVTKALQGEFCDELGKPYKINSKVCVWKTGMDILKTVETLI